MHVIHITEDFKMYYQEVLTGLTEKLPMQLDIPIINDLKDVENWLKKHLFIDVVEPNNSYIIEGDLKVDTFCGWSPVKSKKTGAEKVLIFGKEHTKVKWCFITLVYSRP